MDVGQRFAETRYVSQVRGTTTGELLLPPVSHQCFNRKKSSSVPVLFFPPPRVLQLPLCTTILHTIQKMKQALGHLCQIFPVSHFLKIRFPLLQLAFTVSLTYFLEIL